MMHVRDLVPVGVADGADDLRRGLGALHAHRQQELDLREGIAPRGGCGSCRAPPRRRGEVMMAMRLRDISAAAFCARDRNSPSRSSCALSCSKATCRSPAPSGDSSETVKLIGPVAREHADAPEGDDLHAVLGTEAQTQGVSLEQHAAHRALGVLEREVVVARGVELVV